MQLKNYFLFSLIGIGLSSSGQSLTKIWSTSEGMKTPESALFDSKSNKIFVSNINGNASEKDGNGFISLLDANGKMDKLQWITDLNAPKGQAIFGGNLYVADIDELVIINIKEAKVTSRIKVENAKFLNDVTASDEGIIYVSDMQDHKIYALSGGKLSIWLDDKIIENVNGLWAEKGKLFIGTSQLLEADIRTKEIKVLADNCGGIDGLEKLKNGSFLYSNWQGRIFVANGSKSTKLLDTVEKLNTADIDFVPEKNLVLVPTFSGNSIDAYSFNP